MLSIIIAILCNSPNFSTASTQILGLISGVYVATNNNVAVRTKIIPMFSLSYTQKKKKIVLFFLVDCHYILSSTVNLWPANFCFFHNLFGKKYWTSGSSITFENTFHHPLLYAFTTCIRFSCCCCCFCLLITIIVTVIIFLFFFWNSHHVSFTPMTCYYVVQSQ